MNMSFRRSYFPHYYSLEDILATHERLPCKFEITVHRLGFLDPASESEDIVTGTVIELPYWLARSLSNQRLRIVTIEIPKIYKEAYREILKADACVVDLHKLGLHFYEFGAYLSALDHIDANAISLMLVQAFKERFRQVLDWAQNAGFNSSATHRLDSLEKELYQEGLEARTQLNSWLSGGSSQITASSMVVSHRKRKLTVLDI